MARANLALVKLVEGRLDLEIKLTTHHGLTLSRLSYVTSPIPNLLPSPLHNLSLSPFSPSLPIQRRCAVRRRHQRQCNTVPSPNRAPDAGISTNEQYPSPGRVHFRYLSCISARPHRITLSAQISYLISAHTHPSRFSCRIRSGPAVKLPAPHLAFIFPACHASSRPQLRHRQRRGQAGQGAGELEPLPATSAHHYTRCPQGRPARPFHSSSVTSVRPIFLFFSCSAFFLGFPLASSLSWLHTLSGAQLARSHLSKARTPGPCSLRHL